MARQVRAQQVPAEPAPVAVASTRSDRVDVAGGIARAPTVMSLPTSLPAAHHGSDCTDTSAARLAPVPARECSRTACSRAAVSTLTYVYADSTAVLGPLSRSSEPHTYDLCAEHSAGLTVPRGWTAIRIPGGAEEVDDLVAIASALSTRDPERHSSPPPARPADGPAPRHLHVVRGTHD